MTVIFNRTPASSSVAFNSGTVNTGGNSFKTLNDGNSYKIDSVVFEGYKTGSPTGTNVNVKIYAHTGTFGSGGIATGSALATSDTQSASGFPAAAGTNVTFTFSGANRITLSPNTAYVWQLFSPDDAVVSNYLNIRGANSDNSSSNGNGVYSTDTFATPTAWSGGAQPSSVNGTIVVSTTGAAFLLNMV